MNHCAEANLLLYRKRSFKYLGARKTDEYWKFRQVGEGKVCAVLEPTLDKALVRRGEIGYENDYRLPFGRKWVVRMMSSGRLFSWRWVGAVALVSLSAMATLGIQPSLAPVAAAAPGDAIPMPVTVVEATPQTLQALLDNAAPATVIQLAPGDYPAIRVRQRDWSPAVTVEAGSARLRGVVISDVAGFSWRGGFFDGENVDRNGINVIRGQRLSIEKASFTRYLRNGIGLSEVSDARMIGNSFDQMGSDGIDIALSRRILVDGTRCHDFKPTPGAHADCIQLWSRPTAPPTADIIVINTVAAGDMQGVTAFNHVRDGVDDGGFDRIIFANNDIRITYAQAVSLYDCRNCIARDNFVDTWPQAHHRARVVVGGNGSVMQCGNVVRTFPKLPGQQPCTAPLQLPGATVSAVSP
jgi:hypothetical protein